LKKHKAREARRAAGEEDVSSTSSEDAAEPDQTQTEEEMAAFQGMSADEKRAAMKEKKRALREKRRKEKVW